MNQSFDNEILSKMRAVVDSYRDGLFNSMRNGIENAQEIANTNGITKLSKSCESALGGTENMIKLFDNLCENLENYIKVAEKAQEQVQG